MKITYYLTLLIFLFSSCSKGEDLFISAEHSQGVLRQDKLQETVEEKEHPWDREALLLMESYPSLNWAEKYMRKIYRSGDDNSTFLQAYRRILFQVDNYPALKDLMENYPDLQGNSLYRPLAEEEFPDEVDIISLSPADSRELVKLISVDTSMELKPAALLILDYRIALLDAEYGQAQQIYGMLREEFPPLSRRGDLLYWGWFGLARQEDWQDICESLASDTEMTESLAFALGRIYRSHGQYQQAFAFFEQSGSSDRSRWYALDCLFDLDSSLAQQRLIEWLPDLTDPAYFDDKLEEALGLLLRSRQWQTIQDITALLLSKDEGPVTARYCWISARLAAHGYLDQELFSQTLLYKEASQRDPYGWHGYLGRILYGAEEHPLEVLPDDTEEMAQELLRLSSGKSDDAKAFQQSPDYVLMELLHRGMEDEAMEYAERRREGLTYYSIPLLQALLLRQEEYYQSIHLALDSKQWEHFRLSRNYMTYLHPLAYHEEVKEAVHIYEMDPWLLHGLIRVESAYAKDIISRSGAVGLGQLMPATAEEQAFYLELDDPDLTDPSVNLAISTRYIQWLMERPYVDNLGDMLIAYNGGPGSLRSWKRAWGDLPPEIFWELVPYEQSRKYLPLVFTAGLHYGYLYGNTAPAESLKQWLPDLWSLETSIAD